MRVPTLLAILSSAATVHAQPVASGVDPTPTPAESLRAPAPAPTTIPAPLDEPDWTSAPSPRDASGVVREDARSTTDRMLWIPRSLLFLPRMAVWAVAQPIRGGAYAYERYAGSGGTSSGGGGRSFGISPAAAYESGFGFTLGGRASVGNLFDAGERATLSAGFFGRVRQAYGVKLDSGQRFGSAIRLELDASYQRRPRERFFGIGNADTAIAARFGETVVTNVLTVDARLADNLHARTSGAWTNRRFDGTDGDDSITMQYDTTTLAGFDTGVHHVHAREQLVYDSREHGKYRSKAFDTTGWLASVHGGVTRGLDDDASQFYTVGGEVQRYFDLYDGSRVLVLRALVEAVDGTVSFADLPRLGGSEYLRGYPDGRFRDRAVALGTAEYNWDLGNFLAAFTFVDVGRPFTTETDDTLRVGFGGGVQVLTGDSYLGRVLIAGSRDGDFFLEVALQPSSGRRERRQP